MVEIVKCGMCYQIFNMLVEEGVVVVVQVLWCWLVVLLVSGLLVKWYWYCLVDMWWGKIIVDWVRVV